MELQALLASTLLSLLLLGDLLGVEGSRLFCYRRLKRNGKCGGFLRRTRYSSLEECCANKGRGFAESKVKLGRNLFRCTPCPGLTPPSGSPSGRRDKGSKNRKRNHRRDKTLPHVTDRVEAPGGVTTPSPESRPAFSWPSPPRRDMAVPHTFYPRPKDDQGEAIQWEAWSPCSVSCGAGWRSRAKVCDSCDRNDYDNVQSQPCMLNSYCPVDGNWGPWHPWDACSSTCNGGTRTRHRRCNYPPPAYDGATCPGPALAQQPCNSRPCPVDGSWGEWSTPSACTTTCGPGTTTRGRTCDSPLPQYGGRNCPGTDSQAKRCEVVKCPVDGGWSLWSMWTRCGVTCGLGFRERSRSCESPRPQHGGRDCEGEAIQPEECYGERPCPVDGGWSSWTNYGYCRAPRCGRGYQIRSRTCTSPRPAHGGKPCHGQQYERVTCYNDRHCPKDGEWCQWSEWNQCSSSCVQQTSAVQGRQRVCACPAPRNNGLQCPGDSFQVRECSDLPLCPLPETNLENDMSSGDGLVDDEEPDTTSTGDQLFTDSSSSSSSSGSNNNHNNKNNNNNKGNDEETSSQVTEITNTEQADHEESTTSPVSLTTLHQSATNMDGQVN